MMKKFFRKAALFCQRSLDGQQRLFECRKIVSHGVPYNLAVYALILTTTGGLARLPEGFDVSLKTGVGPHA